MAELYSTDFSAGSNGQAISAADSNWTAITSTIARWAPGIAYSADGSENAYYENAQTWPADQYAEGTFSSRTGEYMGVLCRRQSGGTYYGYYANASIQYLYYQGSSWEEIASSSANLPGSGDVARLECIGSAQTVYINDVSRLSGTDTNITAAGEAGITGYGADTGRNTAISDWAGGDFTGGGGGSTFRGLTLLGAGS